MTDRLPDLPWHSIPRELLRDSRLSAQAKGGLVTLLSHEAGWVRSVIAILMRENSACGRKQAQAIMGELRDAGYAEMNQTRKPDGKFSTGYVVHAVSRSTAQTSLSPGPVRRGPVSRGPVKGAAVVEALDVEALDVDPKVQTLAPTARARDPIWDVLVDSFGQPSASARGAFNAAAKVLRDYPATPDAITSMISSLAGTETNWAVMSPTALAKWFGQREVLISQLRSNGGGRRSHAMAEELRRQGR
jgi:hypothetical protein